MTKSMTKRAKQEAPAKSMSRRRRISTVAARQLARVRVGKTDRKQAVRESGRRRGGR